VPQDHGAAELVAATAGERRREREQAECAERPPHGYSPLFAARVEHVDGSLVDPQPEPVTLPGGRPSVGAHRQLAGFAPHVQQHLGAEHLSQLDLGVERRGRGPPLERDGLGAHADDYLVDDGLEQRHVELEAATAGGEP
jgi:hypothetical protein